MRTVIALVASTFFLLAPAWAGVLFEDAFEYTWTASGTGGYYPCTKDIGGSCTGLSATEPGEWNGFGRTNTSYLMEIADGYGRDSGGGYKLTYPSSAYGSSTEPRLYKWLGATGVNDIYIGWWFKFDDDGADYWDWGDADGGGNFAFWKLFRLYQGVDLGAMKENCTDPGNYKVHPSSYGNFIIPDFFNAKDYSTAGREYLPSIFTTHVFGSWTTGSNSYRRDEFKWIWPSPIVENSLLSHDSATDSGNAGPIYTYAEDSGLAGRFKNAQTWHHIEFRFKLRDVTVGSDIGATYISSTSFSVSGDQTASFVDGTDLILRGCGPSSDCSTPTQARASGSSYGGGITTVTIYNDPVENGPVLSSALTDVAILTENAAGQMQIWLDGDALGSYKSNSSTPVTSDEIYQNTAWGGFNLIQFMDNRYYLVPHATAVYIDDFVMSTERIGTAYVIGAASTTIGSGTPVTIGSGTTVTIQ